jgi:hypothetical protein
MSNWNPNDANPAEVFRRWGIDLPPAAIPEVFKVKRVRRDDCHVMAIAGKRLGDTLDDYFRSTAVGGIPMVDVE